MSNCGVMEVARNDFDGAKLLSYLDISHNNLSRLTNSTFLGAETLLFLNISSNNLETVDESAFSNLVHLRDLNLSKNQIKIINPSQFINQRTLKRLDMNTNLLESFDTKQFQSKILFHWLDLSFNNISKFELISGFNLKHILLASNQLTTFTTQNSVIETVNVQNNKLIELRLSKTTTMVFADNNKLQNITFESPEKIVHLNLGNNSITNIDWVTDMEKLIFLCLSFNRLGTIEINTFSNLSGLQKLYLRNIDLSTIQIGLFSHQNDLQILDISYNYLNTIDFRKWSALNQLLEIYIDGNNLTEISVHVLKKKFPMIRKVGISDNYWKCTDLDYIVEILGQTVEIVTTNHIMNKSNVNGILCFDPDIKNHTELSDPPRGVDNSTVSKQDDQKKQIINENLNLKIHIKDINFQLDILKNQTIELQSNLTNNLDQKTKNDNIMSQNLTKNTLLTNTIIVLLIALLSVFIFSAVILVMVIRSWQRKFNNLKQFTSVNIGTKSFDEDTF